MVTQDSHRDQSERSGLSKKLKLNSYTCQGQGHRKNKVLLECLFDWQQLPWLRRSVQDGHWTFWGRVLELK